MTILDDTYPILIKSDSTIKNFNKCYYISEKNTINYTTRTYLITTNMVDLIDNQLHGTPS